MSYADAREPPVNVRLNARTTATDGGVVPQAPCTHLCCAILANGHLDLRLERGQAVAAQRDRGQPDGAVVVLRGGPEQHVRQLWRHLDLSAHNDAKGG